MSRFGCNKRIKDPSGNWDYEQLIGAKVSVKSLPVSNFFSCFDGGGEKTIKDIYFRISIDGKTITIIELEEYPGKIFTWRDLEVVELSNRQKYDAICGTLLCGQSICGYNVDKELSVTDEALDNGGIALIDEKGNIISNRYIRIMGADVEDPNSDTNNITDINVNIDGDILD